jgi:hypothetical protein
LARHPLAEVFGYPIHNQSKDAVDCRVQLHCRFRDMKCNKDKLTNPLGVCSIFGPNAETIITCPHRFLEDGLIQTNAAKFLFGESSSWQSIPEVKLVDATGKSAGNIDVVIAKIEDGLITDFGALEIQSVYISGNVRNPFEYYMADHKLITQFDWSSEPLYPRADFLSSSRKRLIPQLLSKGKILRAWEKKIVVTLQADFFETLPSMREVSLEEAEIGWMLYDLVKSKSKYKLTLNRFVYTRFTEAIDNILASDAGSQTEFLATLEKKRKRI